MNIINHGGKYINNCVHMKVSSIYDKQTKNHGLESFDGVGCILAREIGLLRGWNWVNYRVV
jgi:hypothetical protein